MTDKLQGWSFQWRFSLAFGLTSLLLATAITATSALFVSRAAERELSAFVQEELDEMRAFFGTTRVEPEIMRELAASLAAEHQSERIAWVIWDADQLWGRFGELDLLDRIASLSDELGVTTSPSPGLRWRVEDMAVVQGKGPNVDMRIGVMVDGRAVLAHMGSFVRIAVFLVLLAGLLGLAAGIFFSRRMTQTLSTIHVERQRMNTLVAGFAHELRSPIQNMLGESQVLLLRERGVDEYRQGLEGQVDELRELARSVDNLVTFCALGEAPPVGEQFDLGEQVELRLLRERARAERRGVKLAVQLDGDLSLEGDREALLLAVSNLVGNAVDFTTSGDRVELCLRGDEQCIKVSVDDSGPGVDPADRDAIFVPFRQGRRRPGQRMGYGLGLALVRSIVESHGGQVQVSDSGLGGARFQLELPRKGQSRPVA
ncbi:MAG: signal transduction histidine kinase [Planctomycetota bacterium]|jgi:signal transduction histidine kinase